ncbi:PREDICTED: uncharacterized protein LOC108364009 [Rhagoletis zephyria]|uniref:uncharacterized protein LOC108364009 n=1 Tax=Rhagoletis zephyria TaxID=28612 RepID=UPI00081184D6|nr:PREDICTED: uncharacterized protein LOC108364009 [Rhagoletis zephyria]
MEDYSDTDGWNVDTLKSPQRIKRNVCSKAASNGVDHDFNDMLTYAQETLVEPPLQQPQPHTFTAFTLPSSPGYQYQQSQISSSYQQPILHVRFFETVTIP